MDYRVDRTIQLDRRTAIKGIAAGGAVLFLPKPALATHVSEPVAPITALNLRLGEYPDLATELPQNGGVADFDKLRIEVLLDIADAPSEHWITRIEFTHSVPGSTGNWDQLFPHQNVGPHNPRRGNNIMQIAQNLAPGDWGFRFVLTGQESGVVLETVATLTAV